MEAVDLVGLDLLLIFGVLLHDGVHVLAHGRLVLHSLLEFDRGVPDVDFQLLNVVDAKVTMPISQ